MSNLESEEVFLESRSGIRLDTPVRELFEKFSYLKEYLVMVNPKFNQLKSMASIGELDKMTVSDLADLGNMPAESMIYMMESRISED
nr:hypothetical protein [uncultured Peptostreptococcus sp.]